MSLSSQERRRGKESQRRKYRQTCQHWSDAFIGASIFSNTYSEKLLTNLSFLAGKVSGPDLKSFVQQLRDPSEGHLTVVFSSTEILSTFFLSKEIIWINLIKHILKLDFDFKAVERSPTPQNNTKQRILLLYSSEIMYNFTCSS